MVASTTILAHAHPYRPARYPMRILAIDPGEKNIGIAISDPSGTIANPLTVILDNPPAHGALTLNSDGSFTYMPLQSRNLLYSTRLV